MDFPLFQVPYLGNGFVIGMNAVLHVILSHGIAIGAMFLIPLMELKGLRDENWEKLAKTMIKPTVIIITALGALTGVGIWFITTALAPRAIGSMLRIFFWPWFIEWMVFTAEVIIILTYYFTWDSWNSGKAKQRHVLLGFAYPFASFWSAFLITGILGFMLTSDGWPWDRSFWSAFFNPTFLPQLIFRLSFGLFLGTLYVGVFIVFGKQNESFKKRALRFIGRFSVASLAFAIITGYWYLAIVPSVFKTFSLFAITTGHYSQFPRIFWTLNLIGFFILCLLCIFSLIRNLTAYRLVLIPAILISCVFVAQFERIREFIRGPFLLPGYMYANQQMMTEVPQKSLVGAYRSTFWQPPGNLDSKISLSGAYLFGQNCGQCHTVAGLNDIRLRMNGRPKDAIQVIIRHAHEMVPFMPPFAGSQDDLLAITEFLYDITNNSELNLSGSLYTGIAGKGFQK